MLLEEIWPIFVASFPYYERRSFDGQQALFNNKYYNCKIYRKNDEVSGFVCFWDFEDFIFVEHLAIDFKYRRFGLGSKILEELKKHNKTIILEIEPPNHNDINTINRVNFYEKNGFKINGFFYEQPPLNHESKFVELKILSYPSLFNIQEFEKIKEKLHKEVYKYN